MRINKKLLIALLALLLIGCKTKLDDHFGNQFVITTTGKSGFTYYQQISDGIGGYTSTYSLVITWEEAFERWPEYRETLEKLKKEAEER